MHRSCEGSLLGGVPEGAQVQRARAHRAERHRAGGIAFARRRTLPARSRALRLRARIRATQFDLPGHEPAHAGADGREWIGPDAAASDRARSRIVARARRRLRADVGRTEFSDARPRLPSDIGTTPDIRTTGGRVARAARAGALALADRLLLMPRP